MGYSAEVVRRARDRLAQAREDRASEDRQHLAEAYERVPRIREIDRELRMTMAQAAMAAFQAGTDGKKELEAVRDRNLALQRERARLVEENFEVGFLDETPICEKCGGTGYVGANMCECLRELCRQEQKKEVSILSGSRESFSHFRLDVYSDRVDPNYGVSPRTVMEKNLRECKNYAVFFSDKSENLLLSGNPGLGKTFLSACIARTVADRGYSVAYETAGHLFTKMERAKFGNDEQARLETESYTQCDLLILDDLGTEMPGQFTNVALYGIVNDRLLLSKPTIISTNLTTEDIAKRYTPQIASRLRGSFKRVPFIGDDIRLLKNGGML
ncbi:ATP-binding protein [Pseudoflavonifractor sp. MSJ-30]|uniref:ATP-binding protein n=1 Tax=Pseudoflavonifractor sp. MSJ-30 TaxID=2841525 RepID=UPI001C0F50A8|nr:ATP-binding protein [Pseudoflavonifractor sp. MSJ-30]MBU5452239.1 ATP-binding protein [Pseudoflavonifractor sp. MSJ-30]